MKAIATTAMLFFIAGVCLAGPRPQSAQQRSNSNIVDILTYNNVITQKIRCSPSPKVYALSQETTHFSAPNTTPALSNSTTTTTATQTFTPSPLINYYKEFR